MEERKSMNYIRTPIEGQDNRQEGGMLSGRILYNTYCAACHQQNGQGDNNRFPPLIGSEFITGDEDRLIGIVLNGRQGEITIDGKTYNDLMPSHHHLDDLAIASILTYIRNRFGGVENRSIDVLQVSQVRSLSMENK